MVPSFSDNWDLSLVIKHRLTQKKIDPNNNPSKPHQMVSSFKMGASYFKFKTL